MREISSTAASVPLVKARLRASSLRELRELAVTAEACGGAGAVRDLLDRSAWRDPLSAPRAGGTGC